MERKHERGEDEDFCSCRYDALLRVDEKSRGEGVLESCHDENTTTIVTLTSQVRTQEERKAGSVPDGQELVCDYVSEEKPTRVPNAFVSSLSFSFSFMYLSLTSFLISRGGGGISLCAVEYPCVTPSYLLGTLLDGQQRPWRDCSEAI